MSIGKNKSMLGMLLQRVELNLRTVKRLDLEYVNNDYLKIVKSKLEELDELYYSFQRNTDQGKGSPSLRVKLKSLKIWLQKYRAGEGELLDLSSKKSKSQPMDITQLEHASNKVERIIRMFESTLPQTFLNIKERYDAIFADGRFFLENFNSFLLDDNSINTEDVLMADDNSEDIDVSEFVIKDPDSELESLDYQLDNLIVPEKTIQKVQNLINLFIEYFKELTVKVDKILALISFLEKFDFIQLIEDINKKNSIILEIFSLLNKVHQKIGGERKLELLLRDEEFDPDFFQHYRDLLQQVANLLPADLKNELKERILFTNRQKLLEKSVNGLVNKRYEGTSQNAFNDLINSDKPKKASLIDQYNYSNLFAQNLSKPKMLF